MSIVVAIIASAAVFTAVGDLIVAIDGLYIKELDRWLEFLETKEF